MITWMLWTRYADTGITDDLVGNNNNNCGMILRKFGVYVYDCVFARMCVYVQRATLFRKKI